MAITRRLIASAILLFFSTSIFLQSASLLLQVVSLAILAAALLLLFNFTKRAALAAGGFILVWEGVGLLDGPTAEDVQKLVLNILFLFLLLKEDGEHEGCICTEICQDIQSRS